ncbi:NAD(P)H-hydrate dehydratase [bacterium]|nr:NAD(P)H-hydrate dehydratase [bacterium]RQV93757.1 MAG: NAD(P)H-hydrate dehydratase [bacterium]
MKITRVEEMRKCDAAAITKYGITDELLMENAGLASSRVISQEFGIQNHRFLILCGIGNNGGDGLVVARQIHSMGGQVTIFLFGDPKNFKGAAKKNFEIVSKLPINLRQIKSVRPLKTEILLHDAVVDALFGTGLTRNVESIYKEAIELVNSSSKTVFSLDIPSGINGNSGQVMGTAVRADFTITFGLPKVGNILYPGYVYCGKLFVSHISFPLSLYTQNSLKIAINQPNQLPPRDANGHKGSFGDVLFIAGALNYFGAPYFSALSFLKAGGGYARLASPASMTPFIANKGSEIVFVPLKETSSFCIAFENLNTLMTLSEKCDMVVLGPGLSLNEETQGLVIQLAKKIEKPLLVDGDGLTALSQDMDIITKRKHPTILTPHLGEMSRMTGKSIQEIGEDKLSILQIEAKKRNAIIALKGAHSMIGYPDGSVFINMSGNSGMATAGSGDVLTGTIAAMLGLGLPLEESVRTGVFLHGFSGDLAAQENGEDGMTAQDILDYLPYAVKQYRDEYHEIIANDYHSIYSV